MKAALIIIDGMADRSQESLGGRTPLQAANTPNLDALAGAGACGHMYPLGPGVCPGSDLAHWHILGYGSHRFPGRAAIEATGAGIDLAQGDVVVRVNLATTMTEGGRRYVQVAPAYLPDGDAVRIASSLADYSPEFFKVGVHHLSGPFMVLVLSGGASTGITDSDPLFYRLPVTPIVPLEGAQCGAAEKTAAELAGFSDWAAGVLESHPVNLRRAEEGMTVVNYVLTKWPSRPPDVPPFSLAWGFDAAAFASGIFYAGLARILEMEFHEPRASDPAGDLSLKLEGALGALEGGRDFAFVHTKAADEASHTGRPGRKVRILEELDGALEITVDRFACDPDILTVITADHATPSGGSDEVIHSGESVPLAMVGRSVRVDGVEAFDEVSCAAGSLGQITGDDVMPLVLNATDRARFSTSRPYPGDFPFNPIP